MSFSARFSNSFAGYLLERREVVELLHAVPPDIDQIRSRKKSQLANALYRGSVVLLSSHLERYIESLVVEAIDAINLASPHVDTLPTSLRLIQIDQPLRAISEMKDLNKKTNAIRAFVDALAWCWEENRVCTDLKADSLISGFDNPLPNRINGMFQHLGITDIVGRAVSLDHSLDRHVIQLKVQELVTKRNAIAHTGMTTDLTREDVITYLRCSRRLVRGIDGVVGQQVQRLTSTWPWSINLSGITA